MLPPELRKQVIEDQTKIVQIHQFKNDGKYAARTIKRDKCTCCGRNEVVIVKYKECICDMCLRWCKKWIRANEGKGQYSRLYLFQAIEAFKVPIHCRFCNTPISRVKDDGNFVRKGSEMCDKCFNIYKAGYISGECNKIRTKYRGTGLYGR